MKQQTETILRIICPHYEDGKCLCNVNLFGVTKCEGNCQYGLTADELINAGIVIRQVGKWYKEPLPTPDDPKKKNMEHYRLVCPFCGRRNGKKRDRFCPNCGATLK